MEPPTYEEAIAEGFSLTAHYDREGAELQGQQADTPDKNIQWQDQLIHNLINNDQELKESNYRSSKIEKVDAEIIGHEAELSAPDTGFETAELTTDGVNSQI